MQTSSSSQPCVQLISATQQLMYAARQASALPSPITAPATVRQLLESANVPETLGFQSKPGAQPFPVNLSTAAQPASATQHPPAQPSPVNLSTAVQPGFATQHPPAQPFPVNLPTAAQRGSATQHPPTQPSPVNLPTAAQRGSATQHPPAQPSPVNLPTAAQRGSATQHPPAQPSPEVKKWIVQSPQMGTQASQFLLVNPLMPQAPPTSHVTRDTAPPGGTFFFFFLKKRPAMNSTSVIECCFP